ncbi:ATP-binding protein [Beijerinckia mobilis]|uniref:ATP-binding protein n=1 Tax=Beijerinckia mobilis TaxID=231434 RepID=UPI000551D94D|nr:ATP-binding protein [Beijerinckia mobilis]
MNFIAQWFASLSLMLKQPLGAYCDVETAHGDALVTRYGDYLSFVRIDGLRRMCTKAEYADMAKAMRLDLSGTLEERGHAIQGFYISDPDLSEREINRVNMTACRTVAKEVGLDLDDILDERMRIWPRVMRWEAAYYVLWTRRGILTKEEKKILKEEMAELAKDCPAIGESQKFFLRSEVMAAHHAGFVARVVNSFKSLDIHAEELTAHEALKVARETLYRETSGSPWKAILPGQKLMPLLPEDDETHPKAEGLLWPSIRSQMLSFDAITQGGQQVVLGTNTYAPIDMVMGPEDPRPFLELASHLGHDRIPWRASFLLEAAGRNGMAFKEIGATFLGMFPQNGDLRRAFAALRQAREEDNHGAVKFRASFATWAPGDDVRKLRRRASTLSQRLEGWGNCKTGTMAGDPLDAAMSSVPGMAVASTAPPSLALLGDALLMQPWSRTASPWETGSVLFQLPHGGLWPYDPAGGSKRPSVVDLFVAPPGSGKSVLANTINLGLCLSSAVLGSRGAKLPMIGKVDIGPSAQGFVRLIQEALGPARRHEAIYTLMQLTPGHEFNVFDLQLGCEYPLTLERAFLQNFLVLLTLPPDRDEPHEGVPQLINVLIDEVYRLHTDIQGGYPKIYQAGIDSEVDRAIGRLGIVLHEHEPHWRDVVNELFKRREYRLAEVAQRHAVPILEDLIKAVQSEIVRDQFNALQLHTTAEKVTELFSRYLQDAIRMYPILNKPTKLDFGPARIIVLDLAEVAPTGSAVANRQTSIMYLLARHILARNFFLKPDYLEQVPSAYRDYHHDLFREAYESIKRLDYDEWHRTSGSPQIRAQAALDIREGRKHNVQLGFSSQQIKDMGNDIISQSTGRWVLRAGDEEEAKTIIERFHLTEASARVLRSSLNGPGPNGAPVLAILQAGAYRYEQLLVNRLGPVELWAFSTTPGDTSLRNTLYSRLGFSEALRRLSQIFPHGSALKEIERRKEERLRNGERDESVQAGVVDELVAELMDGLGIGLKLRDHVDAQNEEKTLASVA